MIMTLSADIALGIFIGFCLITTLVTSVLTIKGYYESYAYRRRMGALTRSERALGSLLGIALVCGAILLGIIVMLAALRPAHARTLTVFTYTTPAPRTPSCCDVHPVQWQSYPAGLKLTPAQAEQQLRDAERDCRPILWTRPENAARAAAHARRCTR